ncbi:hypothetical protein PR001_g12024 [Phytophthora rubi]|uniref:Uncharacterized protein n=1 Tax=Phytophthora rubi TaxID=129364 RepID=A0A6A3M6S3_9STRA|nr:hypothetical protein PR001_g12024 [Phytophthora rubi]
MGAARVCASACCLIQGVSETTLIRPPCLVIKDSEPACCSLSPPRGPVAVDASQACALVRCAVQDMSAILVSKLDEVPRTAYLITIAVPTR